MNEKTFTILEYQKIKDRLKEFTLSELGNRLIDRLEPSTELSAIDNMMTLTSEAKSILTRASHVPLQGLYDIEALLQKIEKGGILYPGDLAKISSFIRGCSKMKKYMKNQDIVAPTLSNYRNSITEFDEIEAEIETSIEGNRVSSKASNTLSKIRKKIESTEQRIEGKLQQIMSSSKYRSYIQDFFVSKRGDRFVIPVKASYKHQIEGNVVDASSTGSTVFIEPASIAKLTNELTLLNSEEEGEEYQILSSISGYIGLYLKELRINLEVMAEYDFAFAKAKYSNSINGRAIKLNSNDYIRIVGGRHPLLGEAAIPLCFEIGKSYRTLVVTGPNTGGKTVALKTIGLLTLMAQSGLHVPADEGTEVAVFKRVLVDIGDSQSIEQSLSTFSGHIKNIIDIMNQAKYSTLILLDEVGTGTDPTEGAALAASILDELYVNGAITVATTHYGEIKDYANQHEGFENGCMEFDSETLKPLYRLITGKAGKSNALWISERLGMRPRVLEKAKRYIEDKGGSNGSVKFNIESVEPHLLQKAENRKPSSMNDKSTNKETEFEIGDCVILNETNQRGIVYQVEDEFGKLIILIKNEYVKIHKKRLALYLKKEVLYPADYDMDTVFMPWKRRKLEKDLERGAIRNKDEFNERIKDVKDYKNS